MLRLAAIPLPLETPHDPPVRPLAGPRSPFVRSRSSRRRRRAGPRAGATSASGRSRAARAREGVPQEVLHAISLTETGRTTAAGSGPSRGRSTARARATGSGAARRRWRSRKASVAAGRPSFDVGCFQINYHWHGRNFPSLEAMFDPDVGAAYAARVPEEPLCRARRLVGGGRGLSLADAGAGGGLPGAVRPHPRRASAAPPLVVRGGGAGGARRRRRRRGRAGRG